MGVGSDSRDRPPPGWMPRALPGLRRCRLAASLSQEELAGRARLARETLCKIECGRPATQQTVRRLAAVLSVPSEVLTGMATRTELEPTQPVATADGLRIVPSLPGADPGRALDRSDDSVTAQPAQADCGTPRASRRLPGLRHWRAQAGLTQEQLASRAGVARETLIRIEHQQRGATPETIWRLAPMLLVAPSMLTGASDLDASIDEPLRTCTDCGALRPSRAFQPIAGTSYVYSRCRLCRSRRKRQRYSSTPDILAAERARSQRNKQRRTYRASPQRDAPNHEPLHA